MPPPEGGGRDIFAAAERLMGMSDAVWERHANPWSVWTRFTCLPLIAMAIYSRIWIGWWAWLALAAALVWTWANPRVFAPNRNWDSWAAKGTLGERVWLHHRARVAAHHIRICQVLTWLSGIGALWLIWGLWSLSGWAALGGLVATILPKVWFVERMVWVWEDWVRAGLGRGDL